MEPRAKLSLVSSEFVLVACMGEGCCRPLGEAESAFFSKEAVLRKYVPFKTLAEKQSSGEKPPYLEDFLREANISPGQKVLEIGINPGYLAVYLAEIVGSKGRVVLAELDGIIVDDARKNIEKLGVDSIVKVTEANIQKLPFNSDSFGVVLSDRTTSLLKQKLTLIKEMARVLKTGGRLVIADCVLRKPFTRNQVEQFRQNFACVFQAATLEDYANIFENSGLKAIKAIVFLEEECIRPHSRIKDITQGHIGFAVICGRKSQKHILSLL